MMTTTAILGFGLAALTGTVLGQTCLTTTLLDSSPTNESEVALQSFSYCGGTFNATAYIANVNYNKVVRIYYTNKQGKSTPLSAVALSYSSSISDTNYELWSSSTPLWIDGITELLNVTYQATDIGAVYVQNLYNQPVNASGAPAPTLPANPTPYAAPTGFGSDIEDWLAVTNGSETETAFTRMFLNINPGIEGDASGTVVAARSGPSYDQTDPDYEYNWVRDSSLTMDVVEAFYAAASNATAKEQYENILLQYAAARATQQTDPNLQTGLGEPKFYLNNTIFSGPWGRPQNDGPATAAVTLIKFANDYLSANGDLQTVKDKIYDSSDSTAPVKKDLLFVASNWTSTSFDLWEEESSDHFYTRLVQRRALVLGAQFATKMGDSETASTLSAAIDDISATFDDFWDPNREILLYEYGPVLAGKSSYIDIAVLLGVIHGYADDRFYGYTDDRILSTAVRISTAFIDVFPIASQTADAAGLVLGTPIGRYPEDIYTGNGTAVNGGNPWYLCTAAVAQFLYGVSASFQKAGQNLTVTDTSKPFFDYFTPGAELETGHTYDQSSSQFSQAIDGLNGWGDAFMRTVKHYTPANGHLAEEFNRNTGVPQGAGDLTWSYASVLTAALARAELKAESGYAENLANLGVVANS